MSTSKGAFMTTVAVIGCTHAGTFATTSILAEHPD